MLVLRISLRLRCTSHVINVQVDKGSVLFLQEVDHLDVYLVSSGGHRWRLSAPPLQAEDDATSRPTPVLPEVLPQPVRSECLKVLNLPDVDIPARAGFDGLHEGRVEHTRVLAPPDLEATRVERELVGRGRVVECKGTIGVDKRDELNVSDRPPFLQCEDVLRCFYRSDVLPAATAHRECCCKAPRSWCPA